MFAFCVQQALIIFMRESGIEQKDYEKITYLGFSIAVIFCCWYCLAAYGIFKLRQASTIELLVLPNQKQLKTISHMATGKLHLFKLPICCMFLLTGPSIF